MQADRNLYTRATLPGWDGHPVGTAPHALVPHYYHAIAAIDPAFRQPYGHNWFLGVERQLPSHMVLELSLIGSAGFCVKPRTIRHNFVAANLMLKSPQGARQSILGLSTRGIP